MKGMGNTPPVLRFEPGARVHTGPPDGVAASLTASVGEPLPLVAWVTNTPAKIIVNVPRPPAGSGGANSRRGGPRPELALAWTLHRGPADAVFSEAKPSIDKAADGMTSTTVTFAAPGDYVLRAQPNDVSGDGGGGFQCCWTNAHVKVTVKPAATQ
jgi:hypothetical protein